MAARAASGLSACQMLRGAVEKLAIDLVIQQDAEVLSSGAGGTRSSPTLAVFRQARNAGKEKGHGSCGTKLAISDGMGSYGSGGVLRGWRRWRAQQRGPGPQLRARRNGLEPPRAARVSGSCRPSFGISIKGGTFRAASCGAVREAAWRREGATRKLRNGAQARPAQRASHRLSDAKPCAGQEGRASSPGASRSSS